MIKGYKLYFTSSVHFGSRRLSDSLTCFYADTFFSALIIEAIKLELDFEPLLNNLVISDSFPFIQNEYYLPKAYIPIENKLSNETDYKVFKKLMYIPISLYQKYLRGLITAEDARKIGTHFRSGEMNTHVKVSLKNLVTNNENEKQNSEPYFVGTYTFSENSGLYFLAEGDEKTLQLLEKILVSLQYSGIGGKRSSGFGQFRYETLPESVISDFNKIESSSYILLSGAMAYDEELEDICKKARYKILKRSGFVQSETYADQLVKRNDYFVFSSGSIFNTKFNGRIFDLSENGNHPIYRYAKGFWIGGIDG